MEKFQKFYSKDESKYLTHDIHEYPHKIVPQIAKELIEKYSTEGDTVLDPFCGSGTSLLEANLLGRNVVGMDINPLACLIAKVKTTAVNKDQLNHIIQNLKEQIHFHGRSRE